MSGRDLTWRMRIRTEDIAEPAGLAKTAGVAEVRASAPAVLDYVTARLAVADGPTNCDLGHSSVERAPDAPEPSVAVVMEWACPRAPAALHLRYDLLFELDPLHQAFASVMLDGETQPRPLVFRHDVREANLTRDVALSRHLTDYLILGVEHIFTGYDHLAFLLALLLAVGLRRTGPPGSAEPARLPDAVRAALILITAFTLAHSVTLIAAGLGRTLLPSSLVEPLIAASVIVAALQNLVASRKVGPAAHGRRWLLVGAFGLVHGLGFGGIVAEIGLPPRGAVACLLAFNVGVELGQVACATVALPLLLAWARRTPAGYTRWALGGISAVLAALGAVWFVARVV